MSVSLGLLLGDFAFIATDTRVTSHRPEVQPFRDAGEMAFKMPDGSRFVVAPAHRRKLALLPGPAWASMGGGSVFVGRRVLNRLQEVGAFDLDRLQEAVAQEARLARALEIEHNPGAEEELASMGDRYVRLMLLRPTDGGMEIRALNARGETEMIGAGQGGAWIPPGDVEDGDEVGRDLFREMDAAAGGQGPVAWVREAARGLSRVADRSELINSFLEIGLLFRPSSGGVAASFVSGEAEEFLRAGEVRLGRALVAGAMQPPELPASCSEIPA
jgi:hypothetical protein